MNIVFDIETTGLIEKGLNWETDFEKFPHIVQIAWIKEKSEKEYIIKPNGYEIPEEVTAIHGISQEKAMKEGVDIVGVLKEFFHDAKECDTLIGHGIYFDTSIIKATALRLGDYKEVVSEILHKDKRFDTMTKSMKLMRTGKYPKLEELHKFLFEKDFDNKHTALSDVKATLRCYDELKARLT